MQSGNTKFVWELLNTVPDPEIPVISVVELGVIRKVKFENNYEDLLSNNLYKLL